MNSCNKDYTKRNKSVNGAQKVKTAKFKKPYRIKEQKMCTLNYIFKASYNLSLKKTRN